MLQQSHSPTRSREIIYGIKSRDSKMPDKARQRNPKKWNWTVTELAPQLTCSTRSLSAAPTPPSPLPLPVCLCLLTRKSSGNYIKKIRSAHVLIICNLRICNFKFSFFFLNSNMKCWTVSHWPTVNFIKFYISGSFLFYLSTTYALGLHSA